MTDSDSQYPISYLCSITTFCLSLAVKKLFDKAVLAGISLYRGKFWGFWGPGTPKIWIVVILTPKRHFLRPSRVVLGIKSQKRHAGFFKRGDREKKKKNHLPAR